MITNHKVVGRGSDIAGNVIATIAAKTWISGVGAIVDPETVITAIIIIRLQLKFREVKMGPLKR